MAKKCTKIYKACAQPLFFSLTVLFRDIPVPIAVAVFLNDDYEL